MYGLNTLLWWTTAFVGGGSPVKKGADVSHPNHRGLDLMTAIASCACGLFGLPLMHKVFSVHNQDMDCVLLTCWNYR